MDISKVVCELRRMYVSSIFIEDDQLRTRIYSLMKEILTLLPNGDEGVKRLQERVSIIDSQLQESIKVTSRLKQY